MAYGVGVGSLSVSLVEEEKRRPGSEERKTIVGFSSS